MDRIAKIAHILGSMNDLKMNQGSSFHRYYQFERADAKIQSI
jgi:hypothetical protein